MDLQMKTYADPKNLAMYSKQKSVVLDRTKQQTDNQSERQRGRQTDRQGKKQKQVYSLYIKQKQKKNVYNY